MLNQNVDRINGIIQEFIGESDRAAAILIGAEIDRVILSVLKTRLLPSESCSINFFRPEGPLGSLASRIELAYRIGLVSSLLHKELHLVRKIRNKFAHGTAGLNFSDSRISSLTQELHIGQLFMQPGGMLHAEDSRIQSRNLFTVSAASILIACEAQIKTTQRVKKADREFFLKELAKGKFQGKLVSFKEAMSDKDDLIGQS